VILNPRRNDVVLDMAAAPGGKTTHLSQLMGNKGVIVAVDINRQRMRSLRSNLERMGIINVLSIRMDARLIPKVFGSNYFDKILLDAPCTAEGLIQIDPERKTKTSIRDIVKAHMLQAELLNAAVDAVKPGGHVLYVTCSIAPEENEFTVSKVISSRNDVRIEHLPNIVKFVPGLTEFHSLPLHPDVRKCGRLYPHIHDMEGYFICLLKKVI
jgi:NOL1/NOP2/sun family putative RNA methylase